MSVSPPRMPKTEVTLALPLHCHTQLYVKYFYLSLGLLAGSLCEHGRALACALYLVCWP